MITKEEFQDYLKRMRVMLYKEEEHLQLLISNRMPNEMINYCDQEAGLLVERIKQYKEHIEKIK